MKLWSPGAFVKAKQKTAASNRLLYQRDSLQGDVEANLEYYRTKQKQFQREESEDEDDGAHCVIS